MFGGGGLGSTLAHGAALGVGSAVGHEAVRGAMGMMGGGGGGHGGHGGAEAPAGGQYAAAGGAPAEYYQE